MADGVGELYEIDRVTAASVFLFGGPAVNDSGLTDDSDADLFRDLDFDANLRSYDPTNGYAQTLRANVGGQSWDGLAFVSSSSARVPEPGSIALFALGALGIAWRRRRRSN